MVFFTTLISVQLIRPLFELWKLFVLNNLWLFHRNFPNWSSCCLILGFARLIIFTFGLTELGIIVLPAGSRLKMRHNWGVRSSGPTNMGLNLSLWASKWPLHLQMVKNANTNTADQMVFNLPMLEIHFQSSFYFTFSQIRNSSHHRPRCIFSWIWLSFLCNLCWCGL